MEIKNCAWWYPQEKSEDSISVTAATGGAIVNCTAYDCSDEKEDDNGN